MEAILPSITHSVLKLTLVVGAQCEFAKKYQSLVALEGSDLYDFSGIFSAQSA